MRRIALTALLVLLAAALFVFGSGAESDDGDDYLVRAAFDNGGFLVPGEEVRIAGANVGVIESVDVSTADEVVSLEPDPHPVPGKAIVVMKITDEAFQDFREDASCIIRPQSLLGERYIDCRATEPRAPGSAPPPELGTIPEGEPGAGQRLLPIERNGKTVDLDLVNNIMKRPYAERFSILINDLGAGLAARGEELGDVIERANPALRETDEVLQILADQDRVLAKLATDSDEVLGPLARERRHVAGFIANAGETAEASAERRDGIERQLELLPPSLRELRALMTELRGFSDQARPVFADLGSAAPELTGATEALGPLATAARPALTSLGDAAEKAGPDIAAADPVIKELAGLGEATTRPAENLNKLLRSLRETGGYDEALKTIFNLSGSFNAFDQFGHVFRTQLLVTNCTRYVVVPSSGCGAKFVSNSSSRAALREQRSILPEGLLAPDTGPAKGLDGRSQPDAEVAKPDDLPTPPGPFDSFFEGGGRFDDQPDPDPAGDASLRGADELFNFLMEPGS